jgi:hypothetical protein
MPLRRRQRLLQPVNQPVMEDEGDRHADGERAQRDEDAGAQLIEVLDERRLLPVPEAPREPFHLRDGVALARWGRRGGVLRADR